MKYCEFHRKEPASSSCSSCSTSYCEACVPTEKKLDKEYCPVCLDTLKQVVTPKKRTAWKKLSRKASLLISKKDSELTALPNVLYKANVLYKEGKNRQAIEYIDTYLAMKPPIDDTHIAIRELYHQILKEEKYLKDMLQHGKAYISILISHGLVKKAFPIYRTCIKTDRTFRLKFATQTFMLCKAAYNAMDHRLFLAASHGFAKHHPDFHNIVELYLMVAKTLTDTYRKDKEALKVLNFLIKQYPDHAMIPQVKLQVHLLKRLKRGAEPFLEKDTQAIATAESV